MKEKNVEALLKLSLIASRTIYSLMTMTISKIEPILSLKTKTRINHKIILKLTVLNNSQMLKLKMPVRTSQATYSLRR